MSSIHTVALDLDDVCTQFAMQAIHQVGATSYTLPYEQYPSECGWDLVDAANTLADPHHKGGFGHPGTYSREQFWGSLDRDFWANLPPMPYLWRLIETLEKVVGQESIVLATSTTYCPECPAGKLQWIQRHMPAWLHREYLLGPRKDLLAQPGVLLIDDRRGTCDKFQLRGGQALIVAQPWNTHNFQNGDTLESLKKGFLEYFGAAL